MTTEQGGAPSASAGGAPAPTFDHESAQENVRRLAQLFGMSVADVAGPPFRPNCRCQVTPLPPFKRRPVLGDPSLNMTGDEDGNTWPEGVGWALSWGCQLTFGRDEKTAVPYVQVSLSDEDRRRGITQRTATRAQVAKFARMLAEQFGEPAVPDPRDAEIEQLRTALARYQKRLGDDLLCGGKLVERVRAALRVDNGSTCIRASMDGVAGDVGRLCDEIERLHLEIVSARSIADEKRAVAEKLRGQVDELETQRDRRRTLWQTRYGQLIGGVLDVQQHLQRALGKPALPSDKFDPDYSRSMVDGLKAERDRLRQGLDLIGEQVPKFQPGQRVRIGLCDGIVITPKDTTRVQFEGMLHTFDIPTRDVHAIDDIVPAAPRRWVAGDPEPEIGTVVRYINGALHPTFTRRRCDGQWHCDVLGGAHDPNACTESKLFTWEQITANSALMPLVEVVSTDG